MTSSLVWQYFREPAQTEFVESIEPPKKRIYWYHLHGIRRTDGFEFIQLVSSSDSKKHFLCRGEFGEFRIMVSRGGTNASPSASCIVYPDEFDNRWPGDQESNRKLCLSHLKEIESAILHFPTIYYFDFIPEESR